MRMERSEGTDRVIGIDLGTTYSAVAVMEGGSPTVVPNAEGQRTTPSVVALSKSGEWLVGEVAKRQAVANPDNTVRSVKRQMGTDYCVELGEQEYAPEELSARILEKLKNDAEEYLGEPIRRAVITVPAYFTDAQRQATKDAGRIAGLEVLRIINEPTAASLAYGLDRGESQRIMVYDLGGGTFDVSILELGDGVFEVLATSGNNLLGGDDFDEVIMDWVLDSLEYEDDIRGDRVAMQRMQEAAERLKIDLSEKESAVLNLPFISADGGTPRHVEREITRMHFEMITAHLVEKTLVGTRQAIRDARMTPEDLDRVILVGGSTRIPAVQRAIEELIGIEPDKSVNPDEVVAMGAAIQAAVLAGALKDVLLLDVTPLSLGVETRGGLFTKLIERNTTIPIRRSQVFSTVADGQHTVQIHVLQGERAMATDNTSLGMFELTGIPPAPRGIPQIEVMFGIDVNGIVKVSARDRATGLEQEVKFSGVPSEDDATRMVRDAEEHAEEDRRLREIIESRNRAEALAHGAEQALLEAEGLADEEFIQRVKDAIEAQRATLSDGDVAEINRRSEELRVALNLMGTSAYMRALMEDE